LLSQFLEIAIFLHNQPWRKTVANAFAIFFATGPDLWLTRWYKKILEKLTRVTDKQTNS